MTTKPRPPRPIFEEMPKHVQKKILIKLNEKERNSCRLVSKTWKTINDSVPSPVEMLDILISSQQFRIGSPPSYKIVKKVGNGCTVSSTYDDEQRHLKKTRLEDELIRRLQKLFARNIEVDTLMVQLLRLPWLPERYPKTLMAKMKKVFGAGRLLQVQNFAVRGRHAKPDDVAMWLNICTPKELKIILIDNMKMKFDELKKMEQFKQAHELILQKCKTSGLEVNDVLHFKFCQIQVPAVSEQELLALKEVFQKEEKSCFTITLKTGVANLLRHFGAFNCEATGYRVGSSSVQLSDEERCSSDEGAESAPEDVEVPQGMNAWKMDDVVIELEHSREQRMLHIYHKAHVTHTCAV